MQLGDAVDCMASYCREIGHTDVFSTRLPDQRDPRYEPDVVGADRPHFVEEASVDLKDNFEQARQQAAEERQLPGFESLGQEGVVGICKGLASEIPCLLPRQKALVHQ
jgi:hypothetical protein